MRYHWMGNMLQQYSDREIPKYDVTFAIFPTDSCVAAIRIATWSVNYSALDIPYLREEMHLHLHFTHVNSPQLVAYRLSVILT